MDVAPDQLALFADPTPRAERSLPAGWAYQGDFVTAGEEIKLIEIIAALPLHEARYKGYTARRRVVHFGFAYDYDDNRLLPSLPLPPSLEPLRAKAAAWIGEPARALRERARRRVPTGCSARLASRRARLRNRRRHLARRHARMRFRRYPPLAPKKADVLSLELAPRSAYVLRAEARWGWQHSVAPTPALRYSITFRTAARRGTRGGAGG